MGSPSSAIPLPRNWTEHVKSAFLQAVLASIIIRHSGHPPVASQGLVFRDFFNHSAADDASSQDTHAAAA